MARDLTQTEQDTIEQESPREVHEMIRKFLATETSRDKQGLPPTRREIAKVTENCFVVTGTAKHKYTGDDVPFTVALPKSIARAVEVYGEAGALSEIWTAVYTDARNLAAAGKTAQQELDEAYEQARAAAAKHGISLEDLMKLANGKR